MDDLSINSISSLLPVDAGSELIRKEANPEDAAASRQLAPQGAGSTPVNPAAAKAPAPAAKASPQADQARTSVPLAQDERISVQFELNRQTNHVTVYIVDRASKRVLRSIPPDELNKLQPGDLVELTR